jgi:hypothetical protein
MAASRPVKSLHHAQQQETTDVTRYQTRLFSGQVARMLSSKHSIFIMHRTNQQNSVHNTTKTAHIYEVVGGTAN